MRCADDERNADDGARLCVLSKRLPPIGRELYEPGPGESTTGWFSARADCEPKPPAPSFDERPNDFCEVAAIPMASYASYCPGSPICSSTFDNRFEPDLNADDGRFASRRAPALVAMPAVLHRASARRRRPPVRLARRLLGVQRRALRRSETAGRRVWHRRKIARRAAARPAKSAEHEAQPVRFRRSAGSRARHCATTKSACA